MQTSAKFTRRNPERRRRETHVTIPQCAGPHVRLVFAEMNRQRVTYQELEDKSGVLRSTTKAWRHKNVPSLTSIEAVLGYLGWDFVPIPRERALPPDVVAELRPIAERLGVEMPNAIALLIAMTANIHSNVAPKAA